MTTKDYQDSLLTGIIRYRMTQTTRENDSMRHPLGYCTWSEEEVLAALDCLCRKSTTMWEKCRHFENEFSTYLRTEESVMVNSGSSANLVMMLAARELGMLEPGDEVLVPAVTWPTQAWSVVQAGFKLKFVDVDPLTLNTSSEILSKAITRKTKAIFLVHLMGNPVTMDSILELVQDNGLLLFEDCCEALGAEYAEQKVGTFGIASSFSFFASHHISTMEGGMISTSLLKFANACRLIRAHGWARDFAVPMEYPEIDDHRYLFLGMGFNFRPTELQGAIGSIQLEKLDGLNAIRALNANRIREIFSTNGHCFQSIILNYKAKPAWFGVPFLLKENLPYSRKDVTRFLAQYGIDTRPMVGGNLTRQPAFASFQFMNLPGADLIHQRGFYIGLPPFKDAGLDEIIGALNAFDSMLRYSLT